MDLTNWRIRGGADYEFEAGTSLASSETLIVVPFNPTNPDNANRLAAFRAHYGIGGSVRILGGLSGNLKNRGEPVRLQRPDTSPANEPDFVPFLTEDEVFYEDVAPWPTAADGQGNSLNRRVPTAFGGDGSLWLAQPPTPGTVNYTFTTVGDVDGDGSLDADDIDRLFTAAAKQSNITSLDLDGNGWIDNGDVNFLVETLLATLPGDSDLDGTVDATDFAAWQPHIFERCGTWATGDFNGDTLVDVRDFNAWNDNSFAVPPVAAPSPRTPRAALASAAVVIWDESELTKPTHGLENVEQVDEYFAREESSKTRFYRDYRDSDVHSPPTREGRGECGDARKCRLTRCTTR